MKYADVQLARRLCPVHEVKPSKDCDDIVEYGLRQKVIKTGDGEYDFVLEDEVYEVSRVNRQAWIAKDAPDVGVLNILEKVRRSGDVTLFNQTHNVFEDSGEVDSLGRPLGKIQDFTDAPGSISEALKIVKAGAASYEELKGIFGDLPYEAMAKLTPEQIGEAINKYVAAQKQPESEN